MTSRASLNDHYRWGWGDGWFNKGSKDTRFKIQFGSCEDGHGSFREECVRAAKLIAASFTKPTIILLSGGSDSMVVCLSYLEANLPFTPLITRTVGNDGTVFNEHDIVYAFEFCKKYGLEPIVQDLNVEEFFKERVYELSKDLNLGSPALFMHMEVIERMGHSYSYVMGGDLNLVTKAKSCEGTEDDPVWVVFGPTTHQQYLISHGFEGITQFFDYTPELLASYLNNPIMEGFFAAHGSIYDAYKNIPGMQQHDWWLCFFLFIKPLFYHTSWPELPQRRKITGIEKYTQTILPAVREKLKLQNEADLGPMERSMIWVRMSELADHLENGGGSLKVWYGR